MELPLGESLPQHTPTGDLANAVTHGVGLALSLAGGRVLIARGRDACDVAIATTFGPHLLESFKVWTDEITEGMTAGSL